MGEVVPFLKPEPVTGFPDGSKKYGVIYADPPWLYQNWSDKGSGRGAVQHYPCMKLKDIMALPVGDIADKDCALLMWVTDPFLEVGFDVLKKWGFTYKTVGFYWAKQTKHLKWHIGNGYYTRANPEVCLLATKGKPQRGARDVRRLVVEPTREHSRKPDRIRWDIMRLFPQGPYMELFARSPAPGWDAWGNQTEKFEEKAA